MWCLPLPPALRLLAPVFAARLAGILAAVAALVARRFVRMPALAGHTIVLWGWLQRKAGRCSRLAGRIAAARQRAPQPRTQSRPQPRPQPHVGVRLVLPRGQAWLVQALGAEAACYGSQLQALLDAPGMADLLAAVPALARLVNPVRRMLGVGWQPRRPVRFVARAALAAAGAMFLLPLPHQFAWPRGPDGAS